MINLILNSKEVDTERMHIPLLVFNFRFISITQFTESALLLFVVRDTTEFETALTKGYFKIAKTLSLVFVPIGKVFKVNNINITCIFALLIFIP